MGLPSLYPVADVKRQWFAGTFPGTDMGGVDKVLLHTTEGSSWPPYSGGSMAPNLTYHAALRQWRQHFPLTRSSRALCDPATTGVRENRDRVVQVEIIAVCDPALAARGKNLLYVQHITDEALRDLGDFLAFMHRNFRVPMVAAPKWLPYPASAGNSPVRMSGPHYDVFRGVLGHQHASGNAHGDPGGLDVAKIIRFANRNALLQETPALMPPLPVLRPVGDLPVRPKEAAMSDSYRYLRTPDGRYWAVAGLQCSLLETLPLRQEFEAVSGLKGTDVKDVSFDFLANLQRIT